MKQNEVNERSINSFNNRESDPSTLLEHRFSKIFHSIPSDVRESKWHGFIEEQLTDHLIAQIQDDVINAVIKNVIEKELYEKKLFEFTSECAREAWLRVFNWVSPKLDPYWRCDKSGRATHLIIDAEPQPSPIDLWMFGNVEQTFLEIADKSAAADHGEKLTEQQRTKLKDSEREKIEQKDRKKEIPATVLCELATSTETSSQKRKMEANVCTLSIPKKHIPVHTARKSKKESIKIKQDEIEPVPKPKRQIEASPEVQKQELLDVYHRRSTRFIKRNEAKISAQRESILQFQPSTDRVDILYTILPEQTIEHRVSTVFGVKRRK